MFIYQACVGHGLTKVRLKITANIGQEVENTGAERRGQG